MQDNDMRTIKSAEKTFDIVETIRAQNGANVSTIARELEMAVSTAHQYLKTLESCEFVVKEGDEYHISLRFLEYGEYARTRYSEYELAKEKVEELAEETQERAQFVVFEHGYGVVLYTAIGDRAVTTDVRIGMHVPLHSTAAGKAILAFLPEEQVQTILDRHGLYPVTERTITNRDEFFDHLQKVREEEIAYNDQERMKRLQAVGTPVRNPNGNAIGALSVSGPTNRLKEERLTEQIPDLLLGTANELELNIEYME